MIPNSLLRSRNLHDASYLKQRSDQKKGQESRADGLREIIRAPPG
jgi:hypothetical protein